MPLWQRSLNALFPRLLSVALTPPFMLLNKVSFMGRAVCYRLTLTSIFAITPDSTSRRSVAFSVAA